MSRLAALLGQAQVASRSEAVRALAAFSATGLILTVMLPPAYHLSTFCGRIAIADVPALASSGLVFPSWWKLLFGWMVMTLAMTPLLVVGPVAHIRHRSLARRRPRVLLLFAIGYGACWAGAGAALAPIALSLAMAFTPEVGLPLLFAVSLCWSASPVAQMARNRCHSLSRIGAFGVAADRDCFSQGVTTGSACVGTCWIWMLAPAMAGDAHLTVMAAVGALMLADRLAPPGAVRWRAPPAVDLFLAFSAHTAR